LFKHKITESLCRRLSLIGWLFSVFLDKLIHSSGRIHEFLFTGEKRVALRTNLDPDIRLGRTGMQGIAAGTNDYAILVLWVYLVFHFSSLFLPSAGFR
jgi:hypothetical protein